MSEKSTGAPSGSTSSAGASPAPTSASPGRAPDSTATPPDSGSRCSGSFAWWSPESSSWRTFQRSFFEGWESYSEGWPRAGTMLSGTASLLKPSAPLTGVTGSSWSRGEYPTPSVTPYGSSQNEGQVPHDRPTRGTPSLTQWAKTWPTPTKSVGERGGREKGREGGPDLGVAVKRWQTPLANEGRSGNRGSNRRDKTEATLTSQAVRRAPWSTPTAHDRKGGRGRKSASAKGSRSLALEAKRWPTATAGDGARSGSRASRGNDGNQANEGTSLTDATCRSGRPVPTTCTHGGDCRWRLNPRFVESLQGFPEGWTDVA